MQQDVLIWLSFKLALLMEGILEDCQGWELTWTSEHGNAIDKVVSADGGTGDTCFLNFSSGSIHYQSDVLRYFKVKFEAE